MINKILSKTKYFVVPFIIIAVCFVLNYLFDYFSNGIILDWLNENFTYDTFGKTINGEQTYVHEINWSVVKSYLLYLIIVFMIILSFALMTAKNYIIKKNKIADSHNISKYINNYILEDNPLPVEIPQEYAEVFTKISEVKAKILCRKNMTLV